MKIVYHLREQDCAAFAEKAANHFREDPRHYTYDEGDPKEGELMAIRWNSFAVLVIKLQEDFEPRCYPTAQFFAGDLPPLKGEPFIPENKSFLKFNYDEFFEKWAKEHSLAIDGLTEAQFLTVLKQSIQSGDFIRQVRVTDGAQQVVYVPYSEAEKWKSKYQELERLVVGLTDSEFGSDKFWQELGDLKAFLKAKQEDF